MGPVPEVLLPNLPSVTCCRRSVSCSVACQGAMVPCTGSVCL